MLLWSGQTVSIFGDAFFNLAIMWTVFTQSGSVLQTAMVQVVWHLSDILFGPIAGILADRLDRRRIMIMTNALAAMITAAIAVLLVTRSQISPFGALVAVFLLNSLTTFSYPARFSIIRTVVNRDLLATASGFSSIGRQVASLVGDTSAGFVIATLGVLGTEFCPCSCYPSSTRGHHTHMGRTSTNAGTTNSWNCWQDVNTNFWIYQWYLSSCAS